MQVKGFFMYPQILQDSLGRSLTLPQRPLRVVSLVPSQTEFLIEAGLGQRLIGITKYCIHPQAVCRQINKVGGTKDADCALILSMKPDLVIANKEENPKDLIDMLSLEVPVWVSDVCNLTDALQMMRALGVVLDLPHAEKICSRIAKDFEKLLVDSPQSFHRVLYLIWKAPYMAAGTDTFISAMLPFVGCMNALMEKRYPVLSEVAIQALAPDLLFLSSEPYHFREKHLLQMRELLPSTRCMLVDGELFSWYGSRLQHSPLYFKGLRQAIGAV